MSTASWRRALWISGVGVRVHDDPGSSVTFFLGLRTRVARLTLPPRSPGLPPPSPASPGRPLRWPFDVLSLVRLLASPVVKQPHVLCMTLPRTPLVPYSTPDMLLL